MCNHISAFSIVTFTTFKKDANITNAETPNLNIGKASGTEQSVSFGLSYSDVGYAILSHGGSRLANMITAETPNHIIGEGRWAGQSVVLSLTGGDQGYAV